MIGVLGEDRTDCATVRVILRRILPKHVGVDTRSPSSGGCAAIRRAAAGLMRDLHRNGCTLMILLHDLDLHPVSCYQNDEPTLRRMLEAIPVPDGVRRVICIPVEEIEAWFWADQAVLDRVGKHHAKNAASLRPHTIKKPKEALRSLSAKAHHKPVYSTNMNEELAAILNITACVQACPSFRLLYEAALSVK